MPHPNNSGAGHSVGSSVVFYTKKDFRSYTYCYTCLFYPYTYIKILVRFVWNENELIDFRSYTSKKISFLYLYQGIV